MEKPALQWHPGFQAVLQIELQENRDALHYESEYNLAKKPLQIDTLIIKAEPGCRIRKSIGHLFRQYNVVEYKSPHDYTGINDFYKVTGYACIFQADTKKELAISPNEITLTFATYHYPYKMIRFLKTFYKVPVMTAAPGITYISGLLFPIQILHIPRLDDHEYLWLSRLRPDLTENDLTDLVREYQSERRNPLYEAAMNLIIRANSEGRKEEKDMWEFLEELFPERFREVNEELEAQRRELEEQRRENQRLRKKNAKLQKKDKELQALRETIKKEQEDEKVRLLVEVCRDIGLGWKDVLKKVMETFDTDSRNAERLVKRYW